MKKKLMALMLAICLCAGSVICPINDGMTVQAASTKVIKSGNYKYIILEDGTAEITKYQWRYGDDTELTIPAKLDGIKVTSIGSSAFYNIRELVRITIPESVTSIGASAFRDCTNLSTINIPKGITSISDVVFCSCGLKQITIPEGVTSIGESAFSGCPLKEVKIPESVTFIGRAAFWNCGYLTSINIPKGITSIEDSTFGATALTSIVIPAGVTSIGGDAFAVCNKLKDVYFEGTKEQWQKIPIGMNNHGLDTATIHFADDPVSDISSKNIKLSKTSLTYNGKAQKPSVTVKDDKGNVVNSKNYTLKYVNNKNVGQATVTVTFKGNYKGTIKKNFNIVPKGTSISQITTKKKGFSLKWKKQTTQTTGYEIQYSTSNIFKGAKTLKNINAKTNSKNISKLSANKKYYVRIRTYKMVKGKKYYSDWSKARNVKTKK